MLRKSATHSIIGPGLTHLLNDGRLELDPNPVENAIRPICMIRK
ncbi:IS66 family transposase [Bradyrhizobium sp. NC92]|nr:IS66 family transposase [Bradyrhizobium sp. NC92]UWU67751.1 IS66 family transposase [Bradyrhizobium sp. NC92]